MKIEEKANEVWRSVVICSETEATSGSSELKNGFTALKYLKDVNGEITPEEIIPIPETIIAPNTKTEFLIRVVSLLNL